MTFADEIKRFSPENPEYITVITNGETYTSGLDGHAEITDNGVFFIKGNRVVCIPFNNINSLIIEQ